MTDKALSLVRLCSKKKKGKASWKKGGKVETHPFVFPPVQLERTTAPQITAGIMMSLERYLLNCIGFETWLQTMARSFSSLNVFIIADSASANVKLTWKMGAFLLRKGEQHGVHVSVHYHACMLHQVARIVVTGLSLSRIVVPLCSVWHLSTRWFLNFLVWFDLICNHRIPRAILFPPKTPVHLQYHLRLTISPQYNDNDSNDNM